MENNSLQQFDICIPTFKRPHSLGRLLTELTKHVDDRIARIYVVDNDKDQSAKPVVEKFGDFVKYDCVPEQNIALARNKLIAISSSPWLLFIDDDEMPDQYWLDEMYRATQVTGADCIVGPVVTTYPASTPLWIVKGGYFQRKRFPNGSIAKERRTGNLLIKRELFHIAGYFNPDFGLTGGEDSDFFFRLDKLGIQIFWWDKAIVYEELPPYRATLHFLLKKQYRHAQIEVRLYVLTKEPGKLFYFLQKKIIIFVFRLLSAPISLVMGVKPLVLLLTSMSALAGALSGLSGKEYLFYRMERSNVT